MKKLHLVYLLILIVGAILFVTLTRQIPSHEPAGDAGNRRAPTARTRKPSVRIAGHVQEADGRPVPGATVFVLPKKKRGADRDDLHHEVTRADGRWALQARQTVDCWIGVVAPGYRNAYLDGDTADPDVQMFLVLQRAPPLEVELKDSAGEPVAGQGVQLEPWPPAPFFFLPGPEARQGEQWAVTDEQGIARFRLGAPGPVRLSPQMEGHHTHPASTWLADARGKVSLTVHESTSMELQLTTTDATGTSEPITGVVTVALFDADTGRSIASHTEMTAAPGLLRVERAVAPGVYDVHISSPGYETLILQELLIPEQPALAEVRAILRPAQEGGSLRVRLDGVGGAEVRSARRRAPLTYLLRDDEGWRRLGWQAGAPEEWNRAQRTLTFALQPGTYHLLVADVLTGRAAVMRGVTIQPGESVERELRLLPGIQPTLPALGVDGQHARTLRVGSATWPRLPVYGSTPDARARMGDFLGCISRQDCGESVRLGPYPATEITLEIVDWSDAVRTQTLR